ncbi:alpha/beta hydrolase [Kitasatospora sp. NPDC058170]|uniref:alpha/beta hydrolase n=1 Tax=Kitasatospora sp. NPDC058170 TaxID=3346364 RepID=UPI0036DED902
MTIAHPAPPEAVPYTADGRLMDVHRPDSATGPVPVVLLWHGRGPDERDVMRPLAREVAAAGLLVLVPDWRSDSADGGREHLLASLDHARRTAAAYGGDVERFVLAGWSMGGREAVAVATHPTTVDGWRPTAAVGIASSYHSPAVTTGAAPLEVLAAGPSPVPVWLVHGTADDVLDADRTRELSAALVEQGSSVVLEEPATDHAGVVLTEYDPAANRCLPARAEHAVQGGLATARVLAAAAGVAYLPCGGGSTGV